MTGPELSRPAIAEGRLPACDLGSFPPRDGSAEGRDGRKRFSPLLAAREEMARRIIQASGHEDVRRRYRAQLLMYQRYQGLSGTYIQTRKAI
jgi:hypothetical protein